jgi:phosphoglycolate phosphatase
MFDLDGTLVDTVRDIANALNYALSAYGFNILTVEKTKEMVGEGLTRLVEKVIGKENFPMREEIVNTFLAYYSEHLTDYSSVYPQVRETLELLSRYKKAVISNKREHLSAKLLDTMKLLTYFDIIVGSDSTAAKKPSALPLIYVLDRFAIKPHEAVMVGDSTYDIEAGKQAKVKTIAVTYGYRKNSSLLDADFMIDSFKNLPAILDIISSKLI